jgi:hypothetical protein
MADAGIGIADVLLAMGPSVCACCQQRAAHMLNYHVSYLAWPAHREHASFLRHGGRDLYCKSANSST